MVRRTTAGIFSVMAGVLLAFASPAAASSIVYIKDDNVFLINSDGTGEHQVTTDGAVREYWSPSQADDGTIVAVKDGSPRDKLVRMRQNGEVLSEFTPPLAPSQSLSRVDDAAISPDGTQIAYVGYWAGDSICSPGGSGFTSCWIFSVTPSTGPGTLGSVPYRSHPSWIDDSTLLLETDYSRMATYTVGDDDSSAWFGRDNSTTPGPGDTVFDGEVSPAGDKVVTAATEAGSGGDPRSSVVMWTTNGPPPAQPDAQCRVGGAAGGKFLDPSWAPDGSAIAWEEGDGEDLNDPGPGEGIWVIDGDVESRPCNVLQGGILVPGGSEPDWGPAGINPGPRSGGTNTGTNTNTGTTPNTGTTSDTGTNTTTADVIRPRFTARVPRPPRLRKALSRGVTLTVKTDEAGSAAARGTVSRRLAARGSARFSSAGTYKVKVRFTKRAKKKFRRARKLTMKVRLTVSDRAGNKATTTRKIKLKR